MVNVHLPHRRTPPELTEGLDYTTDCKATCLRIVESGKKFHTRLKRSFDLDLKVQFNQQ